jgi:methylthioribose-1-phosphate isomerase
VAEIDPVRLEPPHGITFLDQTRLPHEEHWVRATDITTVCEAIAVLRVRGAPLLGLVGAAGMAIAAAEDASDAGLHRAFDQISATRPTAVDLAALARRALDVALALPLAERPGALWEFARATLEGRCAEDRAMGSHGRQLLAGAEAVLTHCNTGALATGGIGTALGVIRCAFEAGTLSRCFVTETRPLLQGARLTTWELSRAGIPATLLPDTAAAALVASGRVQAVITGADRIAANGDTANKVGTYGLALAAARSGVPFYIAAPRSTFDFDCPDGESIPIEFRHAAEVGGYGGQRWVPDGLDAFNPAFDVTPADLITAFVTERGVLRPPFPEAIASLRNEP